MPVTERKTVVLINPNRCRPAPAPVALDYLASELEHRNIDVRILDLCYSRNTRRAIEDFFHALSPDLVGISVRNLDDVVFNCFLAREIKPIVEAVKRSTGAPVVLGGSGFSIAPELMLDYFGLDLGIAGEGEIALPMLVQNLGNKDRYAEIPGLVRREGARFLRNAVGSADMADLRLSERGGVCHKDYMRNKGRKGGAAVQTKRGCSNQCIYCVVPNIEGAAVRVRDPKQIADEMENLAAQGVSRIFLADSEFNYPKEHAEAVCGEFIARGFLGRLTWQAYASPGQFDTDLAAKMKAAGCDLLIATVDSGDDSLLERWNKPFGADDVATLVHACQQAELNAAYCLTLGGPGETMSTLLQTLDLMRSLRPARVTFGEPPGLRIYPSTPLEAIVRQEGFSRSNPNLHGKIEGNENLFEPVYYMSAGLGILIPAIQAWREIGHLHHLSKVHFMP